MILALMGAEVIKIEDPGGGDYVRYMPPLVGDTSSIFCALNRNKKSITLNLKHPEAKEIFLKLLKTADGVVESFRPGVMEKLGLSYASLITHHPSLIYLAISGYGQTGPYRLKAGHDMNYNSLAGVFSITGDKAGRPIIPGAQLADVPGGALFGTIAFLGALEARHRTGKGAYIDMSMTEGSLALITQYLTQFGADGITPGPRTMPLNGLNPCYNIYRTKDGRYMSLGALEPKFWEAFCHAVGQPDWIGDAFPTSDQREAVIDRVEKLFETRTQAEWTQLLSNVDCCCEPVLQFPEVVHHPQHAAREMFRKEDHHGHEVTMVRAPFLFDGRAVNPPYSPAPRLGEHNDEIFASVGVSPGRLTELRSSGAI